MRWSVLLTVSLCMLLLEVVPSSDARVTIPQQGGMYGKRDVSAELERIAAMNSQDSNFDEVRDPQSI
ncbi:hypothetical protein J6590_093099 [Homalodisca vitripennis]|nr:hypothetical protein J6590_093098 [Homalodisca vitripennis]KAG8270077.1 hypothetical protein J6590_093099 [Homalodisca vitripennis]